MARLAACVELSSSRLGSRLGSLLGSRFLQRCRGDATNESGRPLMQRPGRGVGCMVAAHESSLICSRDRLRPALGRRWIGLRELREQHRDRRQRRRRRHRRQLVRRRHHQGAVRAPRARDERRRQTVRHGRQSDRSALGRFQIRCLLDVRRLAAVADRALRRAGRRRHPDDLLHQQRQQLGVGLRRHLEPGGRRRQRDRQPHRPSLPRRSLRLQLRHAPPRWGRSSTAAPATSRSTMRRRRRPGRRPRPSGTPATTARTCRASW